MNDSLLQLFIQLISSQIGLQIRSQDRGTVCQKLVDRMKLLQIEKPDKYYQILNSKSFDSQKEWRELVLLLTTVESYFMRDRGQFDLLKKVILPELIEQKRNLQNTLGIQPTLRLWSAGCSTGEEPYSLAILLKQLISDWPQWKILILGTDINEKVIEKAQQGVYSPWSFRLVDPQVQKQYFNQRQIEWEISRELRQSVSFSCVNLIADEFPNIYKNIYNFDLILCRNVFVYFEHQYISLVLKKFARTLRPGGYLMTGHAEVHGQIMNEFLPKVFPESIVYQRRDPLPGEESQNEYWNLQQLKSSREKSENSGVVDDRNFLGRATKSASFAQGHFAELTPLLTESSPLGKMLRNRYLVGDLTEKKCAKAPNNELNQPQEKTASLLIEEAKKNFKNKAYAAAIAQAKQSLKMQPYNFDADYLLAQIYANLGKYSQAIEHCQRASKVDAMSVFPYYLQAQIAEEEGKLETAKQFLKRIIYLCPSFISAYLDLGNIYHKEGQITRAMKMYNSSCEILGKLPPHTPIEQQGKMTASQVLLELKKKLVRLYSKQNLCTGS
ncbi:MAG: chemotaxis protein CheR [Oscillatoriales cyanobacterium]|uniref:CheR family methyltransferase n=1 Tax=Microcoleus anatoxicus TaxID=2705319 RepID=UPI0030C9A462|nr:MAG: chemotaxis protein CheR [Oscillatoriales cyanobacterium]